MIIRNEDFLFESIKRMAKDYFLFFTVTRPAYYDSSINQYLLGKNDVILIADNYSIEEDETGYFVNNVDIKSLGDVVGMFEKWQFPKTPNLTATERHATNECPISTQDLEKLIKENFIAVELLDGSKGWVEGSTADHEFYGKPNEELILDVTFGDDSVEYCFSSNVKEIIYTKPKHITP